MARVTGALAASAVIASCRRDDDDVKPAGAYGTADDAPPAPGAGPDPGDGASDRPLIPSEEPVIRVRILKVRRAADAPAIGAEGGWLVLTGFGAGGATTADDPAPSAPPLPAVLHAPVRIGLGPGGWSIVDDLGFRPSVEGMETLEFRPVDLGHDARVLVGGRPHPGSVRLVAAGADARDGFDVVNHVPVERYLPGVLSRELYGHWHLETFAAQAVAARSFACSEHSYRGHRPYDVTNTAASQVYAGSADNERAVKAADMTRGLVLAWEGRLVPGYYSSCCGGRAADARDAIGGSPFNDVAPLHGRSGRDICTEAPLHSWSIERDRDDVERRLRAHGRKTKDDALAGLRELRAIEIETVNAHGRPTAYAVVGADGGETILPAEVLRRAVDTFVTGLSAPKPRLYSSDLTAAFDGGTVRFDGNGHGHGAGLCQHGAEALARDGKRYPAIIRWYYPEVEVARAYS